MSNSIKRVFIAGGCGFIGSYLAKQLHAKGYSLLLYDAFLNYVSPFISHYQHFLNERMAGLLDAKDVRIERGDIRDQKRFQPRADLEF